MAFRIDKFNPKIMENLPPNIHPDEIDRQFGEEELPEEDENETQDEIDEDLEEISDEI